MIKGITKLNRTIFSIFLGIFYLLLSSNSKAQYTDTNIYMYIDQYKEIAVQKMKEFKIPASITLAQGIFESACGTSKLATEGNNHFGIKCHKNWEGMTILIDDDELQECFRKYEKVEDSYSDHSLFLTTRDRYKNLFKLNIMDYKAWARGLKEAGYATNPEYANRLISLIERFNINRWDSLYLQPNLVISPEKEVDEKEEIIVQQKHLSRPINQTTGRENKHENERKESRADNVVNKTQSGKVVPIFTASTKDFPLSECPWTDLTVYENNKTQFVIAQKGDTYKSIAKSVQRSEKELHKYNDAPTDSRLIENQVVYIEHKNKKNNVIHIVSEGETLRYIAQKYAVQLHAILAYNNLTKESIIKPGDKIKLTMNFKEKN
ncbi:MAG TPA: glucosaminidase domain-containing protein [Bacteroidales bacterium]|jgi:LysM repeat protein|nr:glucosaminidase domain-containing protein [Bacteroidales bacterium]